MKLLYITPYIPWPLNSGGNQAFFMMADYIRHHHQLSLLLRVNGHHGQDAVEELKKRWDNVTFYVFDEQSVKGQVKGVQAALSSRDRLLYGWYDSLSRSLRRKMRRIIRKVDFVKSHSMLFNDATDIDLSYCDYVYEVSRKGFDAVQIEFYEYLNLVYLLPSDLKKVFVHHELRFVRNQTEMSLFKEKLPTDTILYEQQKACEIAALHLYDIVVTLTEVDKEILSQYIPANKICVSPAITNSVGMHHLSFTPAKELVFVGSNAHFPNADAVEWYVGEVLPVLRRLCQSVPRLNIVGNWDRKAIKRLNVNDAEVRFAGFVDDLQEFINGKISVVPIRIGSGMRMKILDSVSACSPLVTTSKGCEGLPMIHGKNCLIGDTAETFAEAIVQMMNDEKMQEAYAVDAQQVGTGFLDEETLLQKRAAVYERLSNPLNS